MNITVLGAGAMGMLFGSYLSRKNSVWLLDVDESRVSQINASGVAVREKNGTENTFRVHAVTTGKDLPEMDLVIVFVKAMYTEAALKANANLIGKNTYVMTLQNGAGHESKLLAAADREHVIIGSTQHNSSVVSNGVIFHGGSGLCSIGLLSGESGCLEGMAENFTACGLECVTSNEVQKQIWKKLFTNTAASSLTAVLQVPLGFIYEDANARFLMHALAKEAVSVANALGLGFDEAEVIADVETVCKNAPNGYTSIYADIKNGNRTEVDTISGSVVEAAAGLDMDVPYHKAVVSFIHALEYKNKLNKNAGQKNG